MSEFERGFPDCKECRGEGIARRMLHQPIPECPISDSPIGDIKDIAVSFEVIACPACEARRKRIADFERRAPGVAWGDVTDVRDLAYWLQANMPVGARIVIPEPVWSRLAKPYGSDIARFIGADAFETLMENLMGSSWGAWIVRREISGGLSVERREPGDRRTHVSADRRHLFVQVGGELIHRDVFRALNAVGDIARVIATP